MTTTEDVLRRVAAGELTPEQALPLLDAAGASATAASAEDGDGDGPAAADPLPPAGPPAWGTADSAEVDPAVTAIRVHASYRSVEIIADPTVAQLTVTGHHTVRRDGTTLVVESQDRPTAPGADGEPGSRPLGGFTFADLPRGLAWAKAWTEQRLVVRVNPELPLELDAAGASVRVSGIEGGATLRVIAAALKLERVRGPLDIDALSSSVKGFAAPTGRSRIACESSSVKLLLGAGTDVTITARNRLGKVVLPTVVSTGGLVDPEVTRAVVGQGRGELLIEAVMSSVMLTGDDA